MAHVLCDVTLTVTFFFFICHRHINQRRQSAAWALLSIPRAPGACQKQTTWLIGLMFSSMFLFGFRDNGMD